MYRLLLNRKRSPSVLTANREVFDRTGREPVKMNKNLKIKGQISNKSQ